MKDVYIVGEDPVTRAIIKRIIKDYAPHLNILGDLPARGSQLKSKIKEFNELAKTFPVILLSDQDTDDCAPLAKDHLLNGIVKQPNFIVNIAVDEAEAWLFADVDGFSKYLKVDAAKMPTASEQKMGGPHKRIEMDIALKSSYYLTHNTIMESKNKTLKEQIHSGDGCKGPEYNEAVCPFIENNWNIEAARSNSYSLQKMVGRIVALEEDSST